MKVYKLQLNCVKRTTTKCPKGEGKSDIRSYFLIMEINTSLIQLSSVTQSCPTLCDPIDSTMPGLPVYPQLPELAQTHAHKVGDAIQPSHSPLSPSPPAFNLSQHQGLFQWVSSSHQVAKVFELQLQHQSFQISTFFIKKKNFFKKEKVTEKNNKKLPIAFCFFCHYIFYVNILQGMCVNYTIMFIQKQISAIHICLNTFKKYCRVPVNFHDDWLCKGKIVSTFSILLFHFHVDFIFLPDALAISYNVILNRSGKSCNPCLVHHFREKLLTFHCWAWCALIIYCGNFVEAHSFYSYLVESFHHKWVLNFVRSFYCIKCNHMILSFILLLWFITLLDM